MLKTSLSILIPLLIISLTYVVSLLLILALGLIVGTLLKSKMSNITDIKNTASKMKKFYEIVIYIFTFYNYIFIPMIIIIYLSSILIILTVSFFNPISLFILVIIFYSFFITIRTFITKNKNEEFCIEIAKEGDQTGLWNFNTLIVELLQTKSADRIYVVPFCEASVVEVRKIENRKTGNYEKQLRIGLPLLIGLESSALITIIAHEYGHFENPEYKSINLFYYLYSVLKNTVHKHKVKGISGIFNPSLWVTNLTKYSMQIFFMQYRRLNEYLADYYSFSKFGTESFTDAMEQYVKLSVLFNSNIHNKINDYKGLVNSKEIVNIYNEYQLKRDLIEHEKIEYNKIFESQETMNDTHPNLKNRISFAKKNFFNDTKYNPGIVFYTKDLETSSMEFINRKLKINIDS